MRRLFLLFALALCTVALVIVQEVLVLIVGFETLHLVLFTALFVSILFRYTTALAIGVFGGLLLDYFARTFGAYSIPLFFAVVTTNALFLHFFTNRSRWTLLLLGNTGTIIAFILHRLLVWSFASFFTLLGLQLLIHSILFLFFFSVVDSLSSRLKPYLIIRSK